MREVAQLFEKALGKFKELHKEVPAGAVMFTRQEERLAKLKAAAEPPK